MLAVSIWDFLFFLSFAVVVTSSVTTAGVLLVFSFLIVPAVIGALFSRSLQIVLPIAWGAGILASASGLAGSYLLDLPTGAAVGLIACWIELPIAITRERTRLRIASFYAIGAILFAAIASFGVAPAKGARPAIIS